MCAGHMSQVWGPKNRLPANTKEDEMDGITDLDAVSTVFVGVNLWYSACISTVCLSICLTSIASCKELIPAINNYG